MKILMEIVAKEIAGASLHDLKKGGGMILAAFLLAPALHAQSVGKDANVPPSTSEPAIAAAPPTLEQLPPGLPIVTFQNGQLSIVAYNSTLRDVLLMVRKETGATMDIPSDTNQRVVVRLGPGPVRKILDSLLAGSRYNFVMVGSETDPNGLAKILLFQKERGNSERTEISAREFPANNHAPATPQALVRGKVDEESATGTEKSGQDSAADEQAAQAADDSANQATDATAAPRTPNIRSAQEVLEQLYARRRQSLQQPQSSPHQ